MPELPEVEEVRRTLEPHVLNVPITAARVFRRDFVTPATAVLSRLVEQCVTKTHRHGKKLFLATGEGGQTLLVHLGMTGRIDCVPRDSALLSHTHVMLSLESGVDVRFRDPRRFGGLWYYPTLEKALASETKNLGPDALEIVPAHLAHWRETRGRLKQRLLSQRDVAGLGNIYVDEALWLAQLHPLQRVQRITPAQIETLARKILTVLNRSIGMGGTTLRDYRNVSDQPGQFARMLQAYGRGGEPCLRCQSVLKTAQVATRTTVFCPTCQRCR